MGDCLSLIWGELLTSGRVGVGRVGVGRVSSGLVGEGLVRAGDLGIGIVIV